MVNWKRQLEFASLAITTWIFPLFFIIGGFLVIFYFIPLLKNASFFDTFVIYSLIIILLFEGITWNTRFGVGGVTLMQPFKHYLRHQETEDDRGKAILGVFFWPWIVIILIGLFIRFFLIK